MTAQIVPMSTRVFTLEEAEEAAEELGLTHPDEPGRIVVDGAYVSLIMTLIEGGYTVDRTYPYLCVVKP